jgi:hypothetical protein
MSHETRSSILLGFAFRGTNHENVLSSKDSLYQYSGGESFAGR